MVVVVVADDGGDNKDAGMKAVEVLVAKMVAVAAAKTTEVPNLIVNCELWW
jgi:hypothetical protein